MTEKQNTVTYKIANVPGDGIGKEVVPEGLRGWIKCRASSALISISLTMIGAARLTLRLAP